MHTFLWIVVGLVALFVGRVMYVRNLREKRRKALQLRMMQVRALCEDMECTLRPRELEVTPGASVAKKVVVKRKKSTKKVAKRKVGKRK